MRRLLLISCLVLQAGGGTPVHAEDGAYQASLLRSLAKYGESVPASSLAWLGRTFGRSPEQLKQDLANAAAPPPREPTALERLQGLASKKLGIPEPKEPTLMDRLQGMAEARLGGAPARKQTAEDRLQQIAEQVLKGNPPPREPTLADRLQGLAGAAMGKNDQAPSAVDRLGSLWGAAQQGKTGQAPSLTDRLSGLVGGEKMLQALPALGQLQGLLGAGGTTQAAPSQIDQVYGTLLTQLLGYFKSANLVPAPLLDQIGSLMGKGKADVFKDLLTSKIKAQAR